MESIFEVFFHLIFAIFRFIFIDIILEVIFEILIRGTGYGIARCYHLGNPIDFESFEVACVGFIVWIGIVPLCLYWFVLK